MRAFKPLAAFAAATLALGACVSEETASAKRGQLIDRAFPDPADREGIFLVFPMDSGGSIETVEVIWLTDVLGQGEVVRRVQGFCARNGGVGASGEVGIKRDIGATTVTVDGQPRPARQVFFSCL